MSPLAYDLYGAADAVPPCKSPNPGAYVGVLLGQVRQCSSMSQGVSTCTLTVLAACSMIVGIYECCYAV
mgnify:CR=1 FL=1